MKTDTSPIDVFLESIAEAEVLSGYIDEFIGDHMQKDPDNITWGSVGDAGRLVEMLREVTESFGIGTKGQ